MILFHGSKEIVKTPTYDGGRKTNDFGQGFYLTADFGLGCEWASEGASDGYVNTYELLLKNLTILDLTDNKHSILNWLAILLKCRKIDITSQHMLDAKNYILKNFSINTEKYDVICGYRGDDCNFSFACDFLSGTISLQQLSEGINTAKSGLQYALISQKAYQNISFLKYEKVDKTIYFSKRLARGERARKDYLGAKVNPSKALYMSTIIEEGIKANDARLHV
jgi:hypothetical protein